jgi:hypothetical protein
MLGRSYDIEADDPATLKEAPMGKTPYWNDPEIAEQRADELERALPTRRKTRKARQDSQSTGQQAANTQSSKPGQGGERSSAN